MVEKGVCLVPNEELSNLALLSTSPVTLCKYISCLPWAALKSPPIKWKRAPSSQGCWGLSKVTAQQPVQGTSCQWACTGNATHTHITTPYTDWDLEAREKWVLGGGQFPSGKALEECGYLELLPKGWTVGLDLQWASASHKWGWDPLSLRRFSLLVHHSDGTVRTPCWAWALVFPGDLDHGRSTSCAHLKRSSVCNCQNAHSLVSLIWIPDLSFKLGFHLFVLNQLKMFI